MIAVVEPGRLRGTVELPSSKSYAHRLLIAAALADAPVLVRLNARNADIDATVNCLRALGAQIGEAILGAQTEDAWRQVFDELLADYGDAQ